MIWECRAASKTYSTAAVEQQPPMDPMATAATATATSNAAAPSAAAERRKLRILCLHGYLQNAAVFRSRLGSMRKALKSRAEFIFIDAPHLAAQQQPEPEQDDAAVAEDGTSSSSSQGRSWW